MNGVSEELVIQIKAQVQQFLSEMKKAQKATQDFNSEVKKGQKPDSSGFRTTNAALKQQAALIKLNTQVMRDYNKAMGQTGKGGGGSLSKDLNGMIQGLGKFASMAYLAAQAIRVVNQEIQRGIKFNMMVESQTSMFTVLLKDGARAKQIMGEIRDLTLKTPIAFEQAADSAKQLMAYGFESGELVGNLKMLGTVAAATGGRLDDIAYVYGTLRTQGRAYSRDLMQFAMRGIPIYEELARVVGKPVQEIKALTEAGMIGFPEVEKAFKNMTMSGGIYSGALEAKMDTLAGKTEILGKKWEMLMGQMTKAMEGPLGKLIGLGTSAVDSVSQTLSEREYGLKLNELTGAFLSDSGRFQKGLYQNTLGFGDMYGSAGGFASEKNFTGMAGLPSFEALQDTATELGFSFTEMADTLIHFKKSGDDSARSVMDYAKRTGAELNSVTELLSKFGLITEETAESLRILGNVKLGGGGNSAVDFLNSLGINGTTYNARAAAPYSERFTKTGSMSEVTSAPNVALITDIVKQFTEVGKLFSIYKSNLAYYETGKGKDTARADELAGYYRSQMTELGGASNEKITAIISNIFRQAAEGVIKLGYERDAQGKVLYERNAQGDLVEMRTAWQKVVDNLETFIVDVTPPKDLGKEIKRVYTDLYQQLLAESTFSNVDDEQLAGKRAIDNLAQTYKEVYDTAKKNGVVEAELNAILEERTKAEELLTEKIKDAVDVAAFFDSWVLPKNLYSVQAQTANLGMDTTDSKMKELFAQFEFEDAKREEAWLASIKGMTDESTYAARLLHKAEMEYAKKEHGLKMENLKMERAFSGDGSLTSETTKKDLYYASEILINDLAQIFSDPGKIAGRIGGNAMVYGGAIGQSAIAGSQYAATMTGANPLLQLGVEFAEAMQSVESFAKIMNWAGTIMDSVFNIIGPILEAVFLPFANTLEFLGEVIGAILAPITTLLGIFTTLSYVIQVVLMIPLQILANTFKIVSDALIEWFLNPLIRGINGFIKGINAVLGWAGVNIPYLKELATASSEAADALEELNLDKSKTALGDTIDYLNDKLKELADRGVKSAQDLWEVGAITADEYEARIAEANKFLTAEKEKNVLPAALGATDPGQIYAMLQASYEMEKILNEGILIELNEMNAVLANIGTGASLVTVVDAVNQANTALQTLPKDIIDTYKEATGVTPNVESPVSTEQAQTTASGSGGSVAGAAVGLAGGAAAGAALGAGIGSVVPIIGTAIGGVVGGVLGGIGGAIAGFFGFADGTPNILQDQLAMVHKGETIVPATFADAIRRGDLTLSGPNGSNQGGGNVVVNVVVNGSVMTEQELTNTIAKKLYTLRTRGASVI